MQDTIKTKIKKINNLKDKSDNYKLAIEEVKFEQKKANEQFESEIEHHKKSIQSTQSDILDIKNSIIKAELVDIIDAQADRWNIQPEEIEVQCIVTMSDPEQNQRFSKKYTTNQSNTNQYTYVQVRLNPPKSKTNTLPVVFTCKYNGFEPQKDNLPLLQHTTLRHYTNRFMQTVANIEIDDYKQLITQFTFNDLILENASFDAIVASNSLAQMIMDAADKFAEKQSKELSQKSGPGRE